MTTRIYKEKLLKPIGRYAQNKYEYVWLHKEWKAKTISVHRLIAFTFLNLEENETLEVWHKDNCPRNNTVNNLYLCTKKENEAHKVKCWRTTLWEKCGWSKLTKEQVLTIINCKKAWTKSKLLSSIFNISHVQINRIFNWTSWPHLVGYRKVRRKPYQINVQPMETKQALTNTIKYIDKMITTTKEQAYWMRWWNWSSIYKARMKWLVQVKKFINQQIKSLSD